MRKHNECKEITKSTETEKKTPGNTNEVNSKTYSEFEAYLFRYLTECSMWLLAHKRTPGPVLLLAARQIWTWFQSMGCYIKPQPGQITFVEIRLEIFLQTQLLAKVYALVNRLGGLIEIEMTLLVLHGSLKFKSNTHN